MFELRNIAPPGEPDSWVKYTTQIFKAVERINEGEQFQGPTKKRNPQKARPAGKVSGDFKPIAKKPIVKEPDLLPSLDLLEDDEAQPPQRSWWQMLCCCFPFCCSKCCD